MWFPVLLLFILPMYNIYVCLWSLLLFYLIPFKIEIFVCDSACYELVVRVFVVVGGGKAGKGPSVHSMRLCSCSWDARKWSCRSVWLKFLCIVSPSCSLLGSLAKRYKSKRTELSLVKFLTGFNYKQFKILSSNFALSHFWEMET